MSQYDGSKVKYAGSKVEALANKLESRPLDESGEPYFIDQKEWEELFDTLPPGWRFSRSDAPQPNFLLKKTAICIRAKN